ncbi:MAG: TROVE domain-containing protein [Chloroflexota bacterium]|nr:TROVE domain-containing protein [Chloroflexota bacterium]
MTNYLNKILPKRGETPQTMPIPGTNQVPNSAGGYAWAVSHWEQLRRFLILGSEGGSYYASERALTVENAQAVLACIREDGARAVHEIVAVSANGRAPKNDPAIFALALAAAADDANTRKLALAALPKVCRIGTHLFQFAEAIERLRGWGRGLRRGVGDWYTGQEAKALAYQLIKYRQREGWTHTDLLRLAHPTPESEAKGALYKWLTHRDDSAWALADEVPQDDALMLVWAFEQAQKATTRDEIISLIARYDLPREALPTQWLTEAAVWEALLVKMPMTALIRNLGVMAKVGLLTPMSDAERTVIERLQNADALRKARVHPIALLMAQRTYASGRGLRGSGTWVSAPRVTDALNEAFYLAFGTIEPANKRMLLALDVSGSMGSGMVAGTPLTPRECSAAMALVTARTEPEYHIVGFQDKLLPLNVSPKMRLDSVVQTISGLPFGRTDCAQPMLYTLEHKLSVDTFVVYTDSETWAGSVHPTEALVRYREKTGIPARLIVVGMVSNGFTIADPNDAGMLDVVGFDASAPQVMSDFARGAV